MKKRILSIVLCLVMCLSLFPVTASAAERREIKGMFNLKWALEADGDVDIVITDDIIQTGRLSDYKTSGDYFITLGSGRKTVDLNGHKVEMNADGPGTLTFIRVPEGAQLIVDDTSESKGGKLWADGDMVFRDYGGLPYYYNSDVRYRNTICVDGGSFTLEGGEIEAGRAKEVYVYNGNKVDKWYQQLNYALSFGVLAWAIGVRYDGNAYQLVCGDAVTLRSGEVTINGGKVTGKGYRKFGTEFDPDVFQIYFLGWTDGRSTERCAALRALSGKVTLNGGTIYGMANANALEISSRVDVTLNAGYFKTQMLSKVLLPNCLDGGAGNYETNQFVADSTGYDKSDDSFNYKMHMYCAGAGNLGVKLDYLDGNYYAWYDGNPIEKSQWSDKKFSNTAYGDGHSLSLSRNNVDSSFATVTLALEEPKAVDSVDLLGTMAQGMTLKNDTVICNNGKVSVYTTWYRDNELITGNHTVLFGNYLAKVTVTAKAGCKLTSQTKFTLFGKAPLLVQVASDGKSAEVWSDLYSYECDHSCNEDSSIHYDGLTHYQLCTVCGEKIAEERHVMDGGVNYGSTTTYSCTACDYSYDVENGRTKLTGAFVEVPTAVVGETIPAPVMSDEYAGVAKVMSYEWHTGSFTGPTVQPGESYGAGTYYLIVRAKANSGYYFASYAKMGCAAGNGASEVQDDVIITRYTVYTHEKADAEVTLPALDPGMTMEALLKGITAEVGGEATSNFQITVKEHGADSYHFVKRSLSGAWTLASGSGTLESFFQTKIKAETRYDISIMFSTNSRYLRDNDISFVSPGSIEGYTTEGGETWGTVDLVALSGSTTVSNVSVVGVTTPVAGETPDPDCEVVNGAAFTVISGSWNAGGVFENEKAYTFTAKVRLNDGYTFAKNCTGTVNYQDADISISGNTATVSYTFPATERAVVASSAPIASVALTVTAPKIDELMSYDVAAPANAKYTVQSFIWARVEDGKELKDSDYYEKKLYTLDVTLVPKSGESFSDELSATVNNDPALSVVTPAGKAVIRMTFDLASENPFTDVKTGDYFYNAVIWAYYNEPQITNGMGGGKFGPSSTVTRGQAVTFLWRAAGCPEPSSKQNPFTDVKETDYFYKPVLWAIENGITNGTSATTFTPDQTCSTAHIITFLYRTLNPGRDGWYQEAANWARANGLLNGLSYEVKPDENCARRDVVLFLYRKLAS